MFNNSDSGEQIEANADWNEILNTEYSALEDYYKFVDENNFRRKKKHNSTTEKISNATRSKVNIIKLKVKFPPPSIEEHLKEFYEKYQKPQTPSNDKTNKKIKKKHRKSLKKKENNLKNEAKSCDCQEIENFAECISSALFEALHQEENEKDVDEIIVDILKSN